MKSIKNLYAILAGMATIVYISIQVLRAKANEDRW